MNSIQDVRNMSQRLYEYVSAYLRGEIAKEESLVIYSFFNNVVVAVGHDPQADRFQSTKRYPFKDLVRSDEIGGMEPDQQKLWLIANEWLM